MEAKNFDGDLYASTSGGDVVEVNCNLFVAGA
jgi:hypothetical protein